MKYPRLAALLAFLLLAAGACAVQSTPAPDLQATVQAAVKATLDTRPTDTPGPDLEETVVAAVKATLVARPTDTPSTDIQPTSDSDRPYRSYPAPTGFAGFRKYYQKRCYPGCHTDELHPYDTTEGTPTPQAVHP